MRKALLQYVQGLSMAAALVAGVVAMTRGMSLLVVASREGVLNDLAFWVVVLSVSVVALGWVVFCAVFVAIVVVARGRDAVGFIAVRQCADFSSWLSHRWCFFTDGGQQEGYRLAGIEVVLKGWR